MKHLPLPNPREINIGYALRRFGGSFTEGWYSKGEATSADRLRLLMCTYNANMMANMVGGSFWTGLMLLMGADDGFIGAMTMIAVAANMLQMLSPLLLERFAQRKRIIIITRASSLLINIVLIGLIPLFPTSAQARLVLTAIAVLAVNTLGALISPGISVWHLQSIPPHVRTGFYSLITMTTGAVVAMANFLAGRVVDLFKAHGMEYPGLLALRLVALCLAAFDLYLYSKVHEYPYETDTEGRFTLCDLITRPFKERLYMKSVAATFLWNLSANIPGAYFMVYLLKNMGVTYSYIMLVSLMNVVVVLLLTPVWRGLLSRLGWFKTLYVAMALYLVHLIALSLVTSATMWLYPIASLWAFVSAIGINLSFQGIPYANIPEKNQTVFIGFYSTAANFAALIGVGIGRYFILWADDLRLTLPGIEMCGKQLLMLLTAGMMALAAVGIWATQRGERDLG